MSIYTELAGSLRKARIAKGYSIGMLAELGGVSPRLVSEMERGLRPHVSLDTALRLLQLVDVELSIGPRSRGVDEDMARRARAEHRRQTWRGVKTTLDQQDDPEPADTPEARLLAVAEVSRLAYGIQRAYRESAPDE